jgi:hypothetical protein
VLTVSSPPSNVEGSGIGPSITQRLDSYLVRMKFSIFDSEGTWLAASFASQYLDLLANPDSKSKRLVTHLLALAFPHFNMLWVCSSVQESKSTDLTLLMCVPIPRWIPEHRIHTNMPRFQLAHRGSMHVSYKYLWAWISSVRLFFLQSAQLLFDSNLTRLFKVARFCSTRLSDGFWRRDMLKAGDADVEEGRFLQVESP